jgi:hypothetical protein
MSLFYKFFKLPAKEKMLLFEAVTLLFLAKFILVILPFRICIRTGKSRESSAKYEINELKSVKKAIRLANKLAFWKNVCLVQSLAASWMLQRRQIKSTLMIGISHNASKDLVAHAWLMVQDFEVVPQGVEYLHVTEQS